MITEAEIGVTMHFEDRERGHSEGMQVIARRKSKKTDSPLESPEGMQPHPYFDFGLIKLISDL